MVTIAIIISIIALLGAGFAFLRATSSHRILVKRIETLKEKNSRLDERLRKLEGGSGRSNRPVGDSSEQGRRNQPRQEQPQERQEQRQKQKERQPQQDRQPQQQERQQQERRSQERPQQQERQQPQQQDALQPVQPRRKKENRRRNEPMETNKYDELGQEQPVASRPVNLEFAGGDLLAELEQAAGNTYSAPETVSDSGKRYAIIPEDGVIRLHQLQQRPDSDSYIEVDVPADGSNMTGYRFNLSGNHAFVISQGIDRLENAFSFEKPSNRMVSKVVLQGDGVLTKVNNGWKIQEKARIDFR